MLNQIPTQSLLGLGMMFGGMIWTGILHALMYRHMWNGIKNAPPDTSSEQDEGGHGG